MAVLITTLERLYDSVGFNYLLGVLDAMLMYRWRDAHRDPLRADEAGDLAREMARLKKARLPLRDAERAIELEKA